MLKKLFKRFTASLVAFSLFFGSVQPAFASMENLMNNMFNDVLVNYTPAGAYETQMGGVISGPSLYVRSKTSSIQLFNLQLPKRKGTGCNMDIFGGSFSFISKEQLVNFLRQIAANAVPYAFNLALDALCNNCEKHMAKLQALANSWNLGNLNSCQAAQGLVGALDKEFRVTEALKFVGEEVGEAIGTFVDRLEAKQKPGGKTTTENLHASNPSVAKTELELNATWSILNGSAFATAWRNAYGNDIAINEYIMSFLGSVISRYAHQQNASGDHDIKVIPLPPTITSVKNFMQGGPMDVWSCGSENGRLQCLHPTKVQRNNIVGFTAYTKAMLNSIIDKIGDRTDSPISTLTTQEKVFIERAPGSVASHLVKLSAHKGTASTYGDYVANYVALAVTAAFLDEMLTNFATAAVDEKDGPQKAALLQSLRDRRSEVEQQFQTSAAEMLAAESTMKIASLMRESMLAGGTSLSGR